MTMGAGVGVGRGVGSGVVEQAIRNVASAMAGKED